MNKIYLMTAIVLAWSYQTYGQTIQGTVRDRFQPLAGATVRTIDQSAGTSADANGRYELQVSPGTYTLVASYIGYEPVQKNITVAAGETATLDFELTAAQNLNEVVVVGSRGAPRSQLTTPVPVDVIDIREVTQSAPQVTLNQILNYVAPSFTSNTQTLADGTDHIDPASLRGLGPDQVLVLINGKRRHTTSLVNINGSFGKGSVGTDLNAIPTAAIKRVEILRDGASAQYGSDAIAGVINIILNDAVNSLDANVTTGAYVSKNSEDGMDGENVQANASYGVPLGTNGGFLNLSGSYDYRNYTDRGGDYTGTIFTDYNNPFPGEVPTGVDITEQELARRGLDRDYFSGRVGQSANRGGSLFFNSAVPVTEEAEIYAFGGLNLRHGEGAAFYRTPAQLTQTNATIYPNGFLPLIVTDNRDQSLAVGIRGSLGEWKVDFSNTYGQNAIDFSVENTMNASLLTASPTSFEAGGYAFTQNTTNLDFSRFFKDVMSGVNVAFGAEHRYENYQIIAGEEASYVNYGKATQVGTDAAGNPILIPDPLGTVNTRFAENGSPFAGGSQSFPGFSPANAVDVARTSVAAYGDVELNFTSRFLLDAAARFENYSDFGSTLNGKLAGRYIFSDALTWRGAVSTGFRAPSLHQQYYSATSTIFTSGVFVESGTFTNDSRVANLLGIPDLKQETSYNYSTGLTSRFGDFKLTVDGYYIRINNRVVYTGQFGKVTTNPTPQEEEVNRLLDQANAGTARFFTNAIDTETRGIDAVLTYSTDVGGGRFTGSLAGTFAKTNMVGDIHSSALLAGRESTYFDEASRIYLESAVPQTKGNLTLSYDMGPWDFFLRNAYFGKVQEATNTLTAQDWYSGKVVTDVSVGYTFNSNLKLSIGANNLLDVYPDKVAAANSGTGRFVYSRSAQQYGYNGRFLFTRLVFNL
ncbi:TonB-dependent receptor [Pontibacter sp. 172403-2]|uniref:TonB-dependent receptor n=1 Tax=Pontibacter rufus TaxID=2791028 RepID=UPI0018AFA528|nr:TonB-dependent receptor [Pontibacter sp. 172403-2]MBF9254939.1 TonB-dependent receptor [Pontibacter sp. 172403-2]